MSKKKTHEEFYNELYKINPNIILLSEYKGDAIHVSLKCAIDGHEWNTTPSHLLGNKTGCPLCSNRTVVVGINDILTTNPKLALLMDDINDGYKYSINSNKKIKWKCPCCGEITKLIRIADMNRRGLSCKKCGDKTSFPNKFMYNWLTNLNMQFVSEMQFDWCTYIIDDIKTYGVYDFYFEINDNKYIVEMDGGWHDKDNKMSGQTKEESNYIDSEKDRLAQVHNIEVIRVGCAETDFKNIKVKTINSKLSEILNLECVDWNDVFYNCSISKIYKACNLWNSGMTNVHKIANILKLHHDTVSKYLKTGNKIGISSYTMYLNNELNMEYRLKKLREVHGVKVICMNTDELFETIVDAELKYGNGKRLNIVQCCKGKRMHSGKLQDGTQLKWMYYEEYLKLNIDQESNGEMRLLFLCNKL